MPDLTNREIDAKVAENVMGWTAILWRPGRPIGVDPLGVARVVPRYTEIWECMKLVVAKMAALGWEAFFFCHTDGTASCIFDKSLDECESADADTLPRAVSLAAVETTK